MNERIRVYPPRTAFGTLPVWIASLTFWGMFGWAIHEWLVVL